MQSDETFREAVYELVAAIPRGRVMTYGQIAALCGSPRAARIVGGIAHFGPTGLPWQRVVHKDGLLASGYTSGGYAAHRRDLEGDGVEVDVEFRVVNLEKRIWWP